MIGIWIVNELSKIHGGHVQLVELGPGRGTLCKDILRVNLYYPKFLIECNVKKMSGLQDT